MTRRRSTGAARASRTRAIARRERGGAMLPAREIREALAAGASDGELAALHRCSLAAISRIATGSVQPDAGGPLRTERPRRGAGVKRSVTLPRELADRIDRAVGNGEFGRWIVRAAAAALSAPGEDIGT
jgi:hypothetical protein